MSLQLISCIPPVEIEPFWVKWGARTYKQNQGTHVRRHFHLLFLGLICLLTLVACGQQGQPDNPVGAVESYLKLRVASDAPKMLAVSCKDWEGQASIEADSFKSMTANLDGLSCSQSGQDGAFTIVGCQGKIVTQYNGESRNWDLSQKPFKTIQEDGQWKVCGYQATK